MQWITVTNNWLKKMSTCSFIFHVPAGAPPPYTLLKHQNPYLFIPFNQRTPLTTITKGYCKCSSLKSIRSTCSKNPSLAIQIGVLLATVAEPAIAVTGVNNEEEFSWVLTQLGISAFLYFIVAPPIIMNWLRIRWYRRNLLEMYFQFMFVFIFFPGLLLWAPFLNFRKFPRDPSMKYPWSKPENPSQIKGGFLKWPYATPEDYE